MSAGSADGHKPDHTGSFLCPALGYRLYPESDEKPPKNIQERTGGQDLFHENITLAAVWGISEHR